MFAMKSIVAINKPVGPTSHDVVDEVRRVTGEKKVGHAGTLDPMASGVLVIGIGRQATKQLGSIVAKEKEYVATIRLGQTSSTDDEEGEKTKISDQPVNHIEIDLVLPSFVGEITQIPSKYSALKLQGKPAYKRVRAGEDIRMKPRKVTILLIELMDYEWPNLKIRVITGPGVYIRSLARDIGDLLKSGGYLARLERTRVGRYTIEHALTLEQFEKEWQK